jgi:hypothetical protein
MTEAISHRSNVMTSDNRRGRRPMSQVVQAPPRVDARTIAGSPPPRANALGIYWIESRRKNPRRLRIATNLERIQKFD